MAQISDAAIFDPATEGDDRATKEDIQQDIPPEETRSVTEKGQAYFNEKYTERKEIISSVWQQPTRRQTRQCKDTR